MSTSMNAKAVAANTTTANAASATPPKNGRATVRSGMGRNTKLGRPAPEGPPKPLTFRSVTREREAANAAAAAGLNTTKNVPTGTKAHGALTTRPKKPMRAPLPPRVLPRPDRSKKDITICAAGISRNLIRQVGQLDYGNKYRWVNTDEYSLGVYDVVADIGSLPTEEERVNFWKTNYVQIDVDVLNLGAVTQIISHIEKLGDLFKHNVENLFVNLIFSGPLPDRTDFDAKSNTTGTALIVPSTAALVPLADKLLELTALNKCVVTLHSLPGDEVQLHRDELDHAVPFMAWPKYSWRLDWLQQGLPKIQKPSPIRGDYIHHLNVEYRKVEKAARRAAE